MKYLSKNCKKIAVFLYIKIEKNKNNIMNQIITRINFKNKKIKKYFYLQFLVSILSIILILFYYFGKNISDIDYENINDQIKINLNINSIYNKYQTKFLGNLIIEKIELEYPIYSEYTEENLKISICKLSGPNLDEIGNISIIGHNYQDNRFFGKLNQLQINDEIIINNNDNNFNYKVIKKYKTNEEDLTCLNPITKNNKELTLITCDNIIKKNRLIIKAIFNQNV